MNYLNPNKPGSRRHYDLKKFQKKSGVYVLLVAGVLYVGSTKNLQSRLIRWSAIYPGAGYWVKICSYYREEEQRIYTSLLNKKLSVSNVNNPVRPIRTLKPRRVAAPKKVGPGRIPPRVIVIDGVPRTLTQWCRMYGIPKSLFYARLRIGWTPAQAVQPKRK